MSRWSDLVPHWLYRPWTRALQLGPGTIVGKPRLLSGAQFIQIGRGCHIREGAWLGVYPQPNEPRPDPRPHLVLEDGVYLGFYACLTAIDLVHIGAGSVISDYFYASDHTHGHDPRLGSPASQPLVSKGPVRIGRNCFIGYRASILPGVVLGDSCVVGAHAVVTRSFPAMTMLVGVPARVVKRFDVSDGCWKNVSS
jgi:acetyltransferase-like isoleucine patch superfamily enzyme